MAATRLIALHVNKGKTVAQCLADRTDYSQNAAKTNDGEFISSYECDPKTADEEFLLSKRQYQHITGRQQKNNIIAYQIRQSFKPGEITPEEANQVGYETAMRWTKGKHAFIVATHIDKSHIHNHIIYNSTSLDATRKFKNFFLSGLAVQRLSDMVCLEHGLSIITPKPYRERQKRTVYPKKRTQRDELCDAIDAVLKQKPKSFDGFVQALADMGFEFKDGKQPAFKGENQKRCISIYVAQTLTSSFVNHFECSYLLLKPGYMYQAIELQVFDVAHHSEIHNKNLPAQPGQDYCNSYEWYHLTLGFVKAHPKTFLTQYFDEHLGCAKLALECFLSTIPLDHSVSKILPGSQVLGH